MHMARETNLNAGHSLVFAGLRDSTQKCRTVPRNAGQLACMSLIDDSAKYAPSQVNSKNTHAVENQHVYISRLFSFAIVSCILV